MIFKIHIEFECVDPEIKVEFFLEKILFCFFLFFVCGNALLKVFDKRN